MSLYVQYDQHVQQAVDQRVNIRCRPPQPTAATAATAATATAATATTPLAELVVQSENLREQPTTTTTTSSVLAEKNVRRIGHHAAQHYGKHIANKGTVIAGAYQISGRLNLCNHQGLINNNLIIIIIIIDDDDDADQKVDVQAHGEKIRAKTSTNQSQTLTTLTSLITSNTTLVPFSNQERISCWMDIVAGSADADSRPVDSFLRVGQQASLVVKVKQAGTWQHWKYY